MRTNEGYQIRRDERVLTQIGTMYAISITGNESYAYCASKAALHQWVSTPQPC